MVRGQIDAETKFKQQVEKIRQIPLFSPLADLVVHPGRAEFHAVHDLVHFVDHQAGYAYIRVADQLR